MRSTSSQRLPDTDAPSPSPAERDGKGRVPAGSGGYESLLAATSASERRAVETAARTAQALDSVAAWIERAQTRFAETAEVAHAAQERTTHVVSDALGTLGQKLVEIERKVETGAPASVADALKRIETRLGVGAPPVDAPPSAGIQDALRGFEARIANLTERLGAGGAGPLPTPFPRRSLKAEGGLAAAMADIRLRQTQLDRGIAPVPAPVQSAPAQPVTRSAAPGAMATELAHAPILLALRSDMAKLASQLETVRSPDQAAIDHLGEDLQALRTSVGTLASRDAVAEIERAVADLARQVGDPGTLGRGLERISGEIESLNAEMQRLRESRPPSEIERHLGAVAARLDAFSPGDPTRRGAMESQVAEIRTLVSGLAAPADIKALDRTLADLRAQVAAVATRQVDPTDFAALKTSVEDVHRVLASDQARPAPQGVAIAELAEGLRPVETLLHALVDRLAGLERQASQRSLVDPGSLDQLERQIADLAARFAEGGGRDPAVGHIETAMSGLMREIATWREDAFEAAERAARTAVAEAMNASALRPAETPAAAARTAEDVVTRGAEQGLETVNRTLESVAARIANLSFDDAAPPRLRLEMPAEPAATGAEAAIQAALTQTALAQAAAATREAAADPLMAEAERPLPAASDEILLEPGSGRPRSGGGRRSGPVSAAGGTADALDIKSSFIAAARRAAQAAAADTASARQPGAARTSEPARTASPGSTSSAALVARIRALVDRHRRPLLLSAAALVLAMGTFVILGRTTSPGPEAAAGTAALETSRVAPAADDRRDPVTTQSIGPRVAPAIGPKAAPATPARNAPDLSVVPEPAVPPPSALSQAAPPPGAAAPAQIAAVAPAETPSPPSPAAKPAEPAGLPAGLKQAALGGNPVAAYEYAARAADGRGLARDPALAARLFEEAAKKGLAPAQYRLGNLYEKGIGVARDLDRARSWYRRAAEAGNARAMHNLAVLLAEGPNGKPDYAEAVTWFARAAEHGIRDSQFNLAVLYARGFGTAQDLRKSYIWFAVTAAGGDADSAKKRDDVAARLTPADLAAAKASVAAWRPSVPPTAANEVTVPATWPEAPTATASRKPARDTRV